MAGGFSNRTEAGRRLAAELSRFGAEDPVVLALPRGGVPIGLEVARDLNAPLDLIFVRKIGVPYQPELAYGAVVDGAAPETVINRDVAEMVSVPEDFLEKETARQLEIIKQRRELYMAGRTRPPLAGRTVIIVDDGIATGATVRAALIGVRRAEPGRLVLAVPVAPSDTIESLRAEADEVICLESPIFFGAISLYYADFSQLTDDEVVDLLKQADGKRRA